MSLALLYQHMAVYLCIIFRIKDALDIGINGNMLKIKWRQRISNVITVFYFCLTVLVLC